MKAGEIIQNIIDGQLLDSPEELSKALVLLTGHMYHLGVKITETEVAYAKKWEVVRPNYKTDKSCDMFLQTKPEYQDKESAKFAYRTAQEMLRSIKKRLMVLSDEGKLNY